MTFPIFRQTQATDCGPTCLYMLAKFYNQKISLEEIKIKCDLVQDGITLMNLSEAAEQIGFKTSCIKLNLVKLSDVRLPVILHWNKNHYVVLYKIERDKFYLADPGSGLVDYDKKEFKKNWISSKLKNEDVGIILELSPKL